MNHSDNLPLLLQHTYYMTSDRSININQMEQDELDNMYNDENEIGMPDTLAETHTEEQDDWMQKDDAGENTETNPDGAEPGVNSEIEEADTGTAEEHCRQATSDQPERENLTQEDILEYIQISQQEEQQSAAHEIENMHTPREGMIFKTEEEGLKFFNYYAMIVGFSTAIVHTRLQG